LQRESRRVGTQKSEINSAPADLGYSNQRQRNFKNRILIGVPNKGGVKEA